MACHTFDDPDFSIEQIRKAAEENRLLSMEIEFSEICNFRCPYCYLDIEGDKKEMTREESKNTILQARDLGARKIIILGGEPMIYPGIMEMVAFIRENGMGVEIFSNGTNITAENARRLAEFNAKVVLKLNSRDPEIQNNMCGRKDANEIIVAALANLKAAGYGDGGKPMAISSVICRENFDEIPVLWTWIREQQIEPYFEMITPQGAATENEWLHVDSKQVEQLFEQLAEIDRTQHGRDWKPQPPLAGDSCMRHQFSLYVNARGDVMPCVGIDLVVGNVLKNPLADIIKDSEVLQDLRGFRKHLKGPCAICDEVEHCYGCRGAAYQITGDYLASDPMCWHNVGREHEIDHLPLPVDEYVPHRSPVKVVDILRTVGEREAVVESFIGEDCVFVDEHGRLEPAAFVEVIAQSSAAHNGFRTRHLDEPMEGYLLGVKNLEILGDAFVGDRLDTTVYKEAKLGDFGIIRGSVMKGDQCVARGEIKVYHKKSGAVQ